MITSIAKINALLIDIRTVNNSLPVKLQQCGFDLAHTLGYEQEYTISTLIGGIDAAALQFLTITANRNQFIQRTSYTERQKIESCLRLLFACLKQTENTLLLLSDKAHLTNGEHREKPELRDVDLGKDPLPLGKAIDYLDRLKPYSRILELVIAQERIHALSSILEALLQKQTLSSATGREEDHELTEEQYNALELSHYLIKQAL